MEAVRQTNVVTSAQFQQFLKNASNDMDKATAAANRLNEGVRGIQQSIVRMRAEAERRRDIGLAGQILGADPFQTGFGGPVRQPWQDPRARELPAIATAAAAAGVTRTQAALFSLVFTVGNLGEQLAAADTKWQKLDRTVGTALQTIANIAVFYGPTGLLVAGIAAVGNFISAFWTQQREEIERTAKMAEERIAALIDSMDTMQQQRRIQQLEMGRPSAGPSIFAEGVFAGGIRDLEAQIADYENQERIALRNRNAASIQNIRASLVELRAQLAPLARERAELTAAIMSPIVPHDIRGLPGVTSTAGAPRTAAQAATIAAQQFEAAIEMARKAGEVDREIVQGIAQALIKIREERQGVANAIRDDIIGDQAVKLTGEWGDIIRQIKIDVSDIVDYFDDLAKDKLQAAANKMAALNLGLNILSRAGGEIGGALSGIIGGAVAGGQAGGVWGAVIGGLSGLTDAIFNMGASAARAREELRRMREANDIWIESMRLALGDITQSQYDILQIRRSAAEQRRPIEERIQQIEHNPFFAFSAGLQQEYADLQRRLGEINEAERRRVEQLGNEADALNQMTEAAERFRNVPSWFKTNLAVWRAAHPQFAGTGAGWEQPLPFSPTTFGGAGGGGGRGGVNIASMTINTRATNGKELLAEFMAELKRQGLATFGAGEEARMLAVL